MVQNLAVTKGFPILQSWWLPVPCLAYHHRAKSNYDFKLYACNVQSYITTVGIRSSSVCFGHAMSMSSRSVMQGHISTQSGLTVSFDVYVAYCGWPCHRHTDTEQQWHCFHVLPQYCDCDAVLANICILGAKTFIHVGNRQWPCSWAGFPSRNVAIAWLQKSPTKFILIYNVLKSCWMLLLIGYLQLLHGELWIRNLQSSLVHSLVLYSGTYGSNLLTYTSASYCWYPSMTRYLCSYRNVTQVTKSSHPYHGSSSHADTPHIHQYMLAWYQLDDIDVRVTAPVQVAHYRAPALH